MKEFNNIDDILNFAIQNEQNAVDFYTSLAENSRTEDMKAVFIQFAKEEIGHKARLIKIQTEGAFDIPIEKVQDLKISDFVVKAEVTPNMSYEEALVLAMKREKSAFKLYSALSERAPNPELKKLFLALAMDESKHKLRFELEYDEFVLREN